MFPLSILEARSTKSRCQQGHGSLQRPQGSILPCPFQAPAAPQHPLAPVSSPSSWPSSPVSVSLSSPCKDTSHWIRACSKSRWFPSRALIHYVHYSFPNKGIFWPLGRHNFFFFSLRQGDTIRPLPRMWKDPVLSSQDLSLNALPSACLLLLSFSSTDR